MYDLQKNIVKAIMRDTKNRRARNAAGRPTPFDRMADQAIDKAREKLSLPADDMTVRRKMIDKICENLETDKPWENMQDAFIGRRAFYERRAEFIRLVAEGIGITETTGKGRRTRRKRG